MPLVVGTGFISGAGNSSFLDDVSLGYAIPLDQNIALQPKVGVLTAEGGALWEFRLGFSRFL